MQAFVVNFSLRSNATGISRPSIFSSHSGNPCLTIYLKNALPFQRRASKVRRSMASTALVNSQKNNMNVIKRQNGNPKWRGHCLTCLCRQLQLDFSISRKKFTLATTLVSRRYSTEASRNGKPDKRENIFTVPNLLSLARVSLAPVIGYFTLHADYTFALLLLGVAGVTDLLDGFIARHFKNQSSVFGSMLDPVADKVLMSTLTFSLTWVGLLPVPLCVLIIGRDIGLILAVSYLRYKTLPPPLTLSRFFDLNLPTVQMKPTQISKYNTMLQLGLVGLCLAAPVFNFLDSSLLHAYWYFVGSTTILSGLSYVANKNTFKEL